MAFIDGFSDIASPVSAGLAIGGNIISTAMANEANRKLANQANQWSIEQWNRENAYNTPKVQMKRLVEAGLNPNLVFAQGNLMNEAAQSPAVTSAAGTQRAYTVDPLTAAQIANINADTDLKRVQGDVGEQSIVESKNRVLDLVKGIEERSARISLMSSEEKKNERDVAYSKFKQMLEGKQYQLAKNETEAAIRQMNAKASLDERSVEEMIETFYLRVTGMSLSNQLTDKQIANAEQNWKLLGVQLRQGEQAITIGSVDEMKALARTQEQGNFVSNGVQSAYNAADMLLDLLKGLLIKK